MEKVNNIQDILLEAVKERDGTKSNHIIKTDTLNTVC